jgi:hypothetical protein
MILSGAGLIEAGEIDPNSGEAKTVKVHTTQQVEVKPAWMDDSGDVDSVTIYLDAKPYFPEGEDFIYVMLLNNGEVNTEPYIPASVEGNAITLLSAWTDDRGVERVNNLAPFFEHKNDCIVLVDYYVERAAGVSEITITPDKFGGYYYLEASTLFRNTDGMDMPAEFIIPNCKIQSNFTFTMASSGDPSTFTFTIDAFPDYTRFDKTKKVLAAIQIVTDAEQGVELTRIKTKSDDVVDANGMITRPAAAAE